MLKVPERNFEAKFKDDGDGPLTLLSHIKADGFTWEKFKPYYEDPASMEDLYEGGVKIEKLGGETTETSSSQVLMKIKMPILISNRSSPVACYTHKDGG